MNFSTNERCSFDKVSRFAEKPQILKVKLKSNTQTITEVSLRLNC